MIGAVASAAALFGVLLLATGGAASAASSPGCTAESPAQGNYTSQCGFVSAGGNVNYKVSKLGAGSFADVVDFGPPVGTVCSTTPVKSTQVATDGSGTFQLVHPGDCVGVDIQGTGKITASAPSTSCPGRNIARRCRVRVKGG
jgi:hypothetical protein